MKRITLAAFALLVLPLVAGSVDGEAVSGSDGAPWRLSRGGTALTRMTGTGTTTYPLPIEARELRAVAGGFWVVGDASVVRVDLFGAVTGTWTLPAAPAANGRTASVDANGNLWLEDTATRFRIAPDGTLTRYAANTTASALSGSRESALPARGGQAPALAMMGFLILSTLACFAGVFRLFGKY